MTGPCFDCPRACGADRSRAAGLCGAPAAPRVARAALHFGEEPCLSGTRGAGAVFFSGCSLRCIYCQNAVISRECRGKTIDEARLLEIFEELAAAGAHNLDLVTPTHYTSLLTRLLHDNPQPLPVVWNSSGYELVPKLRGLEGAVDVYLPDLKYFDARAAGLYSGAPDYFPVASAALLEMARQTGDCVFDGEGLLRRGLLVRHLVLPGLSKDSVALLEWCAANLPAGTRYSIMAQYTPTPAVAGHPALGRRLTAFEYDRVTDAAVRLGLKGYLQDRESAGTGHIPAFDGTGVLPAQSGAPRKPGFLRHGRT